MSTAVKMWLLLQQISDNSLRTGRDDIFYRIEAVRRKYSGAGQLWDNPTPDLPQYRGFLTDATSLLKYVSREGEKTPELAEGVDFRFAFSCYERLIAEGLKGATIARELEDHFVADGAFGRTMFNALIAEMKKTGIDSGDLLYIGTRAYLGSNNLWETQLKERKR